jgi:uncharacterized membrane protein YwzB
MLSGFQAIIGIPYVHLVMIVVTIIYGRPIDNYFVNAEPEQNE